MAMLLVVAPTEATDPTRVSATFRTTANVTKTSSNEASRRNPWGSQEVRAEKIVLTSHKGIQPARPWNLGSVSLSEGGKKDGSEEEGR
jgi:hypothetical protein